MDGRNPNYDPIARPADHGVARFRPVIEETSKIRTTRFNGLCKGCGLCIVKCPVNAISWHPTERGMLGEPAIVIDLKKCIGCETCERICPDHAIEITNKRLESDRFQKGLLGTVVRSNARVIEWVMTRIKTDPKRLKQVGITKKKTLAAHIIRFFLRYTDEPVKVVSDTGKE